jgi:hypothetical protein
MTIILEVMAYWIWNLDWGSIKRYILEKSTDRGPIEEMEL